MATVWGATDTVATVSLNELGLYHGFSLSFCCEHFVS